MTAWYVDNAVSSSGDGRSWAGAWNSFGGINWSLIKPGDTLFISGGATSQTYTQTATATTPPEISFLGNGVSTADGDSTPSTSDGTNFGSVTQNGAAVVRTFTVRNDGGSTLTLGVPTVPAGFSIVAGDQLASSLAPGASDTFQVQMSTTTIGTKSGQISFSNNDSDESPFNFSITGTVNAATPAASQSLFSPNAIPAFSSWNDTRPVELGVKFQASVDGTITGVRFYKGPQNTGTHIGDLWGSDGKLLATATFTNETASGWQRSSNGERRSRHSEYRLAGAIRCRKLCDVRRWKWGNAYSEHRAVKPGADPCSTSTRPRVKRQFGGKDAEECHAACAAGCMATWRAGTHPLTKGRWTV